MTSNTPVSGTGTVASTGNSNIDDILVEGTAATASITTSSISPATICAGSSATVNYTTSGTITGTYSAQLSDASGSFTATGYPIALTSTGGTAGSSITVTIPATVPAGTGYKIRVNNTAPAITGSASTPTLSVYNLTISPTASQSFAAFNSGTTLSTTEISGSVTNRQWYYGASASGPFTAIGSNTGTSYTPTSADFGNATGTYFVVAKGTVSNCASEVTSNAVQVTITAASVPTLTTTAATATGTTTGTVTGNLTSAGTSTVTERGAVYSSSTTTPTIGDGKTAVAGTGTGSYTTSLSGLVPNTLYNTRTYATSAAGTGYGSSVLQFTTRANVSSTTDASPGLTTAAPGGTISVDGGATISDRGVYYSTTNGFADGAGTKVAASPATGTGAFTSSLTGLTANTTYYIKAYATNAGGTSYGTQVSFTTAALPTVTTGTATATGQTTATADGNVTSAGTGTVTDRGVKYSTTSGFTPATQGTAVSATTPTGTGTFTSTLAGLAAGTTYYVVAYATNSYGTSYGTQTSFTTNGSATLTATPNSLNLGTTALNTPGSIVTYTLSGVGLTGPVTITTPSARVEISSDGFATAGNSSTSSLTIAQAAATSGVTISVRLAASATAGSESGAISNAATGAVTQLVALTGTVGGGTSTCLSDNFNSYGGSSSTASGSTATGLSNYTSAAQSGVAANSAKFDDTGDQLLTPTLSSAASSLSFFVVGAGTNATSSLLVEGFNGSSYVTIVALNNFTTTGQQYTYNATSTPALAAGVYTRFRFTYTKSSGNIGFDDLSVICGTAVPQMTVATGTLSPAAPYCVGQSPTGDVAVTVPFTVSNGSFGAGNVFTAYLSKDNFTTTKIAIGTLNGVSSGTINATIQQTAGLTTATNYRIRVEGNTTATATYNDNGSNLAVSSYLDNEVATAAAMPGNGQATLSFTAPANCVTNVVVTIKAGSSFGTKPAAGGTYVPASGSPVAYATGTELAPAGSGQYVVYNGPATGSITVTGLSNETQYAFGIFTTNGGATGSTGFSNGRLRTVTPVVPGTLTELVVPQYLSGRAAAASTHTTRIPYAWRVTLSNLKPNATYKYYTAARAAADAADYSGVGVPIAAQVAGGFVRGTAPSFADNFTLTTSATGTYTGWFVLGPTADDRFADQALVNPMVVLNNGAGGNTATQFLATSSTVKALYLNAAATGATGVQGSSFGTASNFVLAYDNTAGTGRPLSGIFIESDGSAASTSNTSTFFYNANVDGRAGAYGLLTPNTNANGVQRIEQRAFADGSIVGCVATSATGTWLGGANTVNPTGGATPLVLTTGDTPFVAPTISSLSSSNVQQGQSLTISGSNFPATPNATVTFGGGATATATTVAADGSSLTVVVPATATSGTVTVSNSCGTSAASATSLTIIPLTFYTVTGATDLSQLSSFTGNADGSVGTAPTSFATAGQTFNILGTGRSFASSWTVSGSGAKVVVTTGAELIVPATATLTATVDQAANSTLTIQNTTTSGITQGVQHASSTIDLAQAGTTVYTIPRTLSYRNLKLTNGRKRVPGDNGSPIVVASNLTFDNTEISGSFVNAASGTTGDYSTFYFGGDFTQLAGTTYDASRNIVFQPSNTSTVQNLNANGNTIVLFDVFSPGSTEKGFRLTGAGSVLQVGNIYDGGFALNDASTSLALDAGTTLRFIPGGAARFFITAYGQLKPDPASNIEINRGTAGVDVAGYIPIATGFNSVNNLTVNVPTGYSNSPAIEGNLAVTGTLNLQSGELDLNNYTLTISGALTGSGSLAGRTSASSNTSNVVVNGTGSLATLNFLSGYRNVNNLTMNRTGATLTLGTPVLANALTLTDGLISTTNTNLLTVVSTTAGALTGGSATSYVSGPLARATPTGARATVFPIGKDNFYRPFTLNATAQSNTRTYTAELMNSNGNTTALTATGSTGSTAGGTLQRVSTFRYTTLTPSTTSGTFSGTATLSFGPEDRVTDPTAATLVVAKRTNSSAAWGNFGHTAHSSTGSGQFVSGTLTSDVFTTFSDFALASTEPITGNNSSNVANPLPVTLVRFSARRETQPAGVSLTWITASEKNSAYFDVERSLTGTAFEPVARVAARGSAQLTTYTSVDATAPASLLYYRLRQVDTDGTVAYSPVVTVAATGASPVLGLYPNPAHDVLYFTAPAAGSLRVFNTLGQTLRTATTEAGATKLSVEGLAAGTYYLELRTSTGSMVQKFAKE